MKTATQTLFTVLVALLVLAGCASKQPSPNLCASVCDGLVAYYPFYGDATDKFGNGHDGKVIGATLTKDRNGYPNSAYQFNGKNTMIELPKNSQITDIVRGSYTLSVWVKINEDTGNRLMDVITMLGNIGHNGLLLENRGMRFSMDHWVKDKGNENKRVATRTLVKRGEYYHLVATIDATGGVVSIYIDGNKERSKHWNVGPEADQRSGVSWGIGKVHPNNFYAPLSGTVDEVRLYNRALSADEVTELYLFASAFPPAE